jgi:nucleotide-binding universal stress UspA family protein
MTTRQPHILAPVDFSDEGRPALDAAADLANRHPGAKLTLLHVYQLPNLVLPEGYILASPQQLEALLAKVSEKIEQLRQRAVELGADTHVESVAGVPWLEIVRYAEQNGVDLIVMGTHGRTGLRHALIGSVAERVVRHAPCAVLVVRNQKGIVA